MIHSRIRHRYRLLWPRSRMRGSLGELCVVR